MSINTTIPANLDASAIGRSSSIPFVDVFSTRDPTPQDVNYQTQKKWLNTEDGTFWELQNFVSSQGVVTANWIKIGSVGLVETLTGNDGIHVPATDNNIFVLGAGGTYITGDAATSTLTVTSAGISVWNFVSTNQVMNPNEGYCCISPGGALTLQLPATSEQGDMIRVVLRGASSFEITQLAGQTIYVSDGVTLTGTSGSVTSTGLGDAIELVCSVANETWVATSYDGNLTVAGSPTSQRVSTNTFFVAKWIVSPDPTQGTHTTIQAAIDDASAGDTIYIREGNYIEDLIGKSGVCLASFACSGAAQFNVNIFGNLTFNVEGQMVITGIALISNGGSVITMTGSTDSTLTLDGVFLFFQSNNGILISNSTATLDIRYCNISASNGNVPINLSGGFIVSQWTNWGVSDTNCSISNGGTFELGYCLIQMPVETFDTSVLYTFRCQWGSSGAFDQTWITAGSSGGLNRADQCSFYSGSSACVTISGAYSLFDCILDSGNTHAVTGAGTLAYGNLLFSNTGALVNVATMIPRSTNTVFFAENFIASLTVPGAYPYDVLSTDYLIEVDTSSAQTINLPNAPFTGQVYIIKDSTGTAAANNITLTTVGGTVLIDGTTSVTMSTNYQSVRVIFNGTKYLTW